METVEEIYKEKMVDIDTKLDSIRQDLKRLMERSNKEYLDMMLTNLKKDFLNSVTSYVSMIEKIAWNGVWWIHTICGKHVNQDLMSSLQTTKILSTKIMFLMISSMKKKQN